MTIIRSAMKMTFQGENKGFCFGDSYNQTSWPDKRRYPAITRLEYNRLQIDEDGGALPHLADIHVHLTPDSLQTLMVSGKKEK